MSDPVKDKNVNLGSKSPKQKQTNIQKIPYSPPEVRYHGLLRDITLGSTGGVFESGGNGAGWHWDD